MGEDLNKSLKQSSIRRFGSRLFFYTNDRLKKKIVNLNEVKNNQIAATQPGFWQLERPLQTSYRPPRRGGSWVGVIAI